MHAWLKWYLILTITELWYSKISTSLCQLRIRLGRLFLQPLFLYPLNLLQPLQPLNLQLLQTNFERATGGRSCQLSKASSSSCS
ncbi:hypothetical protein GBA52_028293 [Prunus armeniaca]|nr:hypothetical protein GBA52_028293 [Prunus armeniaca]